MWVGPTSAQRTRYDLAAPCPHLPDTPLRPRNTTQAQVQELLRPPAAAARAPAAAPPPQPHAAPLPAPPAALATAHAAAHAARRIFFEPDPRDRPPTTLYEPASADRGASPSPALYASAAATAAGASDLYGGLGLSADVLGPISSVAGAC